MSYRFNELIHRFIQIEISLFFRYLVKICFGHIEQFVFLIENCYALDLKLKNNKFKKHVKD